MDTIELLWFNKRSTPGGRYFHRFYVTSPSQRHASCFYLMPITNEAASLREKLENNNGPDLDTVRKWLRDCSENHEQCSSYSRQMAPSLRVIDCQSKALIMIEPGHPYVALSYVWGDQAPILAPTPDRLPTHLPKTIEDAMEVSLKLDVGYLWVDRYCINQTDEEEKRTLIPIMDLIYQNAEFTIIAAVGDNPNHGLPGIRGCSRVSYPNIDIGGHKFSVSPDPSQELWLSSWGNRGW